MGEGDITVDDTRLQARIEELYDALAGAGRGSDCATILEDEARLFLKTAIALTPPKNKAQGENAVKSDLKKIFTPVEDVFAQYIASEFGTSGVDKWLTSPSDGRRYELKWDTLDVQGYGMDAYHERSRNARGRVPGRQLPKIAGKFWPAKYVVSQSAFASYLAKLKTHVGMRKSGWLRAYYEVGGKLPSWIQRHASKGLGRVVNNLATPGKPSITMASHAPGALDDERVLREAFKIRIRVIGRRIKLLASGYAKDVASGMRIRKHAAKTATD